MVCCVSMENRKHDVNVTILKTHGVQPFSAKEKIVAVSKSKGRSDILKGTYLDVAVNAFLQDRHA